MGKTSEKKCVFLILIILELNARVISDILGIGMGLILKEI
jgi:hypothetical protein